jgi:hypothetical protein
VFLRDLPCLPNLPHEVPRVARPESVEVLQCSDVRSGLGLKLGVEMEREGGKKEKVLLDTCAETNVMTKKKAKEFGIIINDNRNNTNRGISQIGNQIKVIDQASVKLNGRTYIFNIIEAEFSKDAEILIGWPELKEVGFNLVANNNEVLVEVDNKKLKVLGVEFKKDVMKKKDLCNRVCVEIRVKGDVRVRAKEQRVINIKYDNSLLKEGEHLLTESIRSHRGSPLQIVRGAIRNGCSKLIISNFSDNDIDLKNNDLIAYGMTTSGTYEVLSIEEVKEEIEGYKKIEDEMEGLSVEIGETVMMDKEEYRKKLEEIIKMKKEEGINNPILGRLKNLLVKYKNLFVGKMLNRYKIEKELKTKVHVKFKDEVVVPIKERPRRVPYKAMEELRKMIEEMLENNIIEKVDSAWAFPVVLARKPDGSWRFCVDYSKLNDLVVKDSYPLPNIEELVDQLREAKFMSVVDLASGFWQIPVEESAKEKLSFVTHFGTYTWKGMPFGLMNAPAIFQRAINETLNPVLFKYALVYVDDVIIYSETLDEHMTHLDNVFSLFSRYGWKVKMSKCRFLERELDYLGYRVGGGRVKPTEKNINKVLLMKRPETPSEMESFLGMIGYYKKFINGYDYIVKPLRKYVIDVRKKEVKNKKFNINDDVEAKEAYETLLNLLITKPILEIYDPTKPIIVKTDASAFAWGAVLCQVHDGVEKPVQFASGSLNSSQRNWPAWKREAYGSLRAVEKWRCYLIGNHFRLVTDHKANQYLMDPNRNHSTMIENWKILLSQYSYTVEHRPGKTLVLEDALSRTYELLLLELKSMKESQLEDNEIQEIVKYITEGKELSDEVKEKTKYIINNFIVEEGVLYFTNGGSKDPRKLFRLVIAKSQLDNVFEYIHNREISGHFAFERTYQKFIQNFWCFNSYSEIKKRYLECNVCQLNKITKLNNIDNIQIEADGVFDILEVDHVEVPLVGMNKYKYILTATDVFSRKTWFIPVTSLTAKETYEVLFTYIFSPFCFPNYIYSDNGSAFRSELDEMINKAVGVKREYTRPGSKGHTGSVEVRNKVVELIITKYLNIGNLDEWPRLCAVAAAAYNSSVNDTGYSPNMIVFGEDYNNIVNLDGLKAKNVDAYVRNFITSIKDIRDGVTKLMRKTKRGVESKAKKSLEIGDWVTLSKRNLSNITNRKFANRNIGPYEIVEIDERNHVVLRITPSKNYTASRADVEKYYGNPPSLDGKFRGWFDEVFLTPIPVVSGVEEKLMGNKYKKEYDVRSIVSRRIQVWWPSTKSWWKATVVGYTGDLKSNLLFYDVRSEGVDVREDFYKSKLFSDVEGARVEKWSLLSPVL